MSDYTIAVNWSGKDALSDSDAAKVISGSDFNTEFTTVRTAVNSKADTNGDSGEDFAANNVTIAGTCAITGNATAPTQSASDNSTKVATTAYVTTAVAAVAFLVLANHPHRPQKIEQVHWKQEDENRETMVVWSVGDFLNHRFVSGILLSSSAASDTYKRQVYLCHHKCGPLTVMAAENDTNHSQPKKGPKPTKANKADQILADGS